MSSWISFTHLSRQPLILTWQPPVNINRDSMTQPTKQLTTMNFSDSGVPGVNLWDLAITAIDIG